MGSEECMYTGFCDAFSVGRNMLRISVDGGIESTLQCPKGLSVTVTSFFMMLENQPMYLHIGDTEALFKKIRGLSLFIH